MAPELIEIYRQNSNYFETSIENAYNFARKADSYSLGLVIYDTYMVGVYGYEYKTISHDVCSIRNVL